MRRTAALLVSLLALSFGLAGCGGGEEASPTPETVEGTLPEQTTTEGGGGGGSTLEGDAANGEKIFASAGCGGCHTLEAAGSSGSVGPNLDEAKPDLELAVDRVTNGSGAMPSFKDQLSEQEIADVAAYVVQSTSG
jgi:mono/diheme cytochrome c family protein